MTVSQLIQRLEEIEDKDKNVRVMDGLCFVELKSIFESDDDVYIE